LGPWADPRAKYGMGTEAGGGEEDVVEGVHKPLVGVHVRVPRTGDGRTGCNKPRHGAYNIRRTSIWKTRHSAPNEPEYSIQTLFLYNRKCNFYFVIQWHNHR